MKLIYICEDCKHENTYTQDGRRKVSDSIWITCQNSSCERFLITRRMWLKKDIKKLYQNNNLTLLQEKIIKETRIWYELGCETYKLKHDTLTITFKKCGSVAGTAWTNKRLIDYNLTLAEENQADFINKTIPHEVAHIIANRYFNKHCGHGEGWRHVMDRFGIPAIRCHDYNVQSVSRRKFVYRCECNTVFYVSKILHERIQKGSHRICIKCKSRLTFVDK